MRLREGRTLVAAALQLAALALLLLALAGVAWLDARSQPRWLVLVDRSASVPPAAAEEALTEVVGAAREAGAGELRFIEFAGRTAPPAGAPVALAAALEPSATNLEAALLSALASSQVADDGASFGGLVMISDGLATTGDTPRALQALRDAGLQVHWRPAGRPTPPVRIAEVLAPARATIGQPLQVTVRLAGPAAGAPLRVTASVRAFEGSVRGSGEATARDGQATIELVATGSGALLVDVALEEASGGRTIEQRSAAAVIDVGARAPILYVQGGARLPASAPVAPLADSLRRGGWKLEVVPAARLDAFADLLAGYRAVILDDVAVNDAGERLWHALAEAVRSQGLGLLVLGGERSFARGGYRGSVLESLLPLRLEPAALEQAASVVFVVDKSGSMGEGSAGVDRFHLAQRAVLETAHALGEHDALGLVVFDVEARILVPLVPATEGLAAIERDWPVTPGGGTRLAPAVEAAAAALEGSGAARRLLVLVTDGFVDEAPLAALRERLARARIETLALAVGPDADDAALARVVGASGVVLRVREAAELPRVMRTGVERRRARVERGAIGVLQRGNLPFAPLAPAGWPAVAAYHVTRPQPQAMVPLLSERGDPLLALHLAGSGRVVALATGLGAWTPDWLAWREWPRLAGGLAEWTAGVGEPLALKVTDLLDALLVETELTAAADGPLRPSPTLTITPPGAAPLTLTPELAAPGRWRARQPAAGPGLYSVTAVAADGTRGTGGAGGTGRHLHLRRAVAEDDSQGLHPDLPAWQAQGWIHPWDAQALRRPADPGAARRPTDRVLLALALLLFAAGVVVDRSHTDGRVWRVGLERLWAALRRWRSRGADR